MSFIYGRLVNYYNANELDDYLSVRISFPGHYYIAFFRQLYLFVY